MFREIQLPNGNSKVHLLRISPLKNQSNINENSQEVKAFPDKLGNNLNPDTRSNSSCESSSTNSSTRPVSPLCNLVLPGLNELVLNNEKIFRKKVVPVSPNDSNDDADLEVDTESFELKPRDFKNMKLVQMFEPPVTKLSKMQSVDNLTNSKVADMHILPGGRDVFMTTAPVMNNQEHSEAKHLEMGYPEHTLQGFQENMPFDHHQNQETFSNQFEVDRRGDNTRMGSVSASENSVISQTSNSVTAECLKQLERRMTQQVFSMLYSSNTQLKPVENINASSVIADCGVNFFNAKGPPIFTYT